MTDFVVSSISSGTIPPAYTTSIITSLEMVLSLGIDWVESDITTPSLGESPPVPATPTTGQIWPRGKL